jgi:hypothetical protein
MKKFSSADLILTNKRDFYLNKNNSLIATGKSGSIRSKFLYSPGFIYRLFRWSTKLRKSKSNRIYERVQLIMPGRGHRNHFLSLRIVQIVFSCYDLKFVSYPFNFTWYSSNASSEYQIIRGSELQKQKETINEN